MEALYRQVALMLLVLVASSAAQETCTEAKQDVAVIIDASGSIAWKGVENWPTMLGFVRQIIDDLNIGQDRIRIALVAFSTNVSVEFNLNRSYNKTELKQLVNATEYTSGTTNTAGAINTMQNVVFSSANGDRPGVGNLAIIITDGVSTNNPGEAVSAAMKAKAEGTTIVAIGVTGDINEAELRMIANNATESTQYFFKIQTFDKLQTLLDDILKRVCTTPKPPPVTGCPNPADIYFLMDASGSIREPRFLLVKSFLKTTLNLLDIDTGRSRVGLIVYSTNVRTVFTLNRFTRRSDMLAEIDKVSFLRGTTNTREAIRVARQNGFGGSSDRSNVRNIIVILTDGGSNDLSATLNEAFLAKTEDDITIISVGIGDWVNEQEVNNLASYPYQKNRIRVSSFNGLNSAVARTLRDALCNNVNECGTNPCRNSGQCIDSINTYYCVCRSGFAGKDCIQTCRSPSDVVINMDTSGSVGRTHYANSMEFAAGLVNALPITSMARIGFTTYASDVRRFFTLNQLSAKERYMNALGFAYNGGRTNTQGSISYMYNTMFQPSQGDRQGIQNVGITVTDGRSNDPEATWRRSMEARARGIHMVAVGVSDGQNAEELQSIASYPASSNVISVANTRDLSGIVGQLVSLVCNNVDNCANRPCQNNGQCTDNIGGYSCRCSSTTTGKNCERRCGGALDLIFAIDTSGSIHHERFPKIIEFLIKMVDEMEIAQDRTRIGAVRFGDSADVQFDLNDYSTKQDVQHALRRIQYVGGRTNIADALRIARTQMFTAGNGDRSSVQNMLVLLSDGESNLNTERTVFEAIDARVANIHIISIGIGQNPRMSELVSTASQPTNLNVVTSQSFNTLDDIVASSVAATCDDTNECDNNPCQSGGRCIDGIKDYVCVCSSGRTGKSCERSCSRSMDITFILDVSGSVEIAYTITQALAQQVAYGLHVNDDRVRVALITFGTTASKRFELNKYRGNLRAVINAMVIPFTGGKTNIGAALNMARTSTFTSANGDRNGVNNKILLVTDGNDNDARSTYSSEATSLRNNGVEIFVVKVGRPNNNVINNIASNPDNTHTFEVSSASAVTSTANAVLDRLCA